MHPLQAHMQRVARKNRTVEMSWRYHPSCGLPVTPSSAAQHATTVRERANAEAVRIPCGIARNRVPRLSRGKSRADATAHAVAANPAIAVARRRLRAAPSRPRTAGGMVEVDTSAGLSRAGGASRRRRVWSAVTAASEERGVHAER